MSTLAQVARIRARHADHAGNPSIDCDACRALKLLDQAREALDRIQEMASKSQLDPASVTAVVKAGKGPEGSPATFMRADEWAEVGRATMRAYDPSNHQAQEAMGPGLIGSALADGQHQAMEQANQERKAKK